MSLSFLTVLLVSGSALAAPSGPARPLPKGPPPAPPRFVTVAEIDQVNGVVVCFEMLTVCVPCLKKETRVKDGKEVEVEVTALRTECKTVVVRFETAAGKAYDGAGILIKPARLWDRLEIGAVVLLSRDGKRPHGTWRAALKKGTIVLVPALPGAPPPTPAETE